MNIPAPQLSEQIDAIFSAWGMSEPAREACVRLMVAADLRGIDSHGVMMLPLYDELRQDWRLKMDPRVKVVRESPVTALVDGDMSLGHYPADYAIKLAIRKARGAGLAAVAVRNSNHFGAAGVYAMQAASAGLIGMAMTNVWNLAIVLYRGGRITEDANAALAARLLTPVGGTPELSSHKGYGLAAMVEILCAMLPGAWYAPTRERRHPGEKRYNVGHFFLAMDPHAFRGEGEFEDDLDDMIAALRSAKRLDAAQPVLVHGDPERAEIERRGREGVPVPEALAAKVRAIAGDCGAPALI